MNIEKDIHVPAGLMLVGIQNLPFPGRNVLNFFLQGMMVFAASAIFGFVVGEIVGKTCN